MTDNQRELLEDLLKQKDFSEEKDLQEQVELLLSDYANADVTETYNVVDETLSLPNSWR